MGHVAAPSFVTVGGLQYAAPYEDSQVTSVKDHLAGKPLCEVLGEMWRLHRGQQPLEEAVAYWRSEVLGGRVQYRLKKRSKDDDAYRFVTPHVDILVERQSSLRITKHKHVRVVPAVDVRVLFENADMIAIDKPAGIATCAAEDGANCLMSMVQRATGFDCLPAHRLDKPVSGVLLLGKSKRKAKKLLQQIQQKSQVTKTYVARCQRAQLPNIEAAQVMHATAVPSGSLGGIDGPLTVEAPLRWDSAASRAFVVDVSTVPHEHDGKELLGAALATTRIRPLCSLPDGTVLVEVQPVTGQRHQIRAHLSHLGWPIANDTVYGGRLPPHGQARAFQDDELGTLSSMYGAPEHWCSWCPKCNWTQQQLSPDFEREPPTVDGGIWLHSHRYQIPEMGIDVAAGLPSWAADASPALFQCSSTSGSCEVSDKTLATTMLPTIALSEGLP